MVKFRMDLKIHRYVAILLDCQPPKKQEIKEENSAVDDSGFTGNVMEVSDDLNNVRPTKNIINAKCTNG